MNNQVLIIEDQTILARNIVRFLARKGIDATAVRTSIDALPRIIGVQLDWLILDVNLPDTNGLDFYASLRTQCLETKVVLMSGHIDPESRERAQQLGICHLLVKPFPLSILYSIIHNDKPCTETNNNETTPLRCRPGNDKQLKRDNHE